jgi:hypothetical protein
MWGVLGEGIVKMVDMEKRGREEEGEKKKYDGLFLSNLKRLLGRKEARGWLGRSWRCCCSSMRCCSSGSG